MNNLIDIVLLVVLNSLLRSVYSFIYLKYFNKNLRTEEELHIQSGELTIKEAGAFLFGSFIFRLFSFKNLLFTPISVLIIYLIFK
jgi:hypothetical protein